MDLFVHSNLFAIFEDLNYIYIPIVTVTRETLHFLHMQSQNLRITSYLLFQNLLN